MTLELELVGQKWDLTECNKHKESGHNPNTKKYEKFKIYRVCYKNQVFTTYPLKALNIEKKYKTLKSA